MPSALPTLFTNVPEEVLHTYVLTLLTNVLPEEVLHTYVLTLLTSVPEEVLRRVP